MQTLQNVKESCLSITGLQELFLADEKCLHRLFEDKCRQKYLFFFFSWKKQPFEIDLRWQSVLFFLDNQEVYFKISKTVKLPSNLTLYYTPVSSTLLTLKLCKISKLSYGESEQNMFKVLELHRLVGRYEISPRLPLVLPIFKVLGGNSNQSSF